ncbi:MAG: site-specific integrase [Oscillospiraceae bacterium]|nr:site-specific integrase [Oscillospiraceae bacterium]
MTEIIFQKQLTAYHKYLLQEEKSAATIEKYLRDVRTFMLFAAEKMITKELTVTYKKYLQEQDYAVRSINSMIASLNSLLLFIGRADCRVKTLCCQKQTYCAEEKELTKAEYLRLWGANSKFPAQMSPLPLLLWRKKPKLRKKNSKLRRKSLQHRLLKNNISSENKRATTQKNLCGGFFVRNSA